MRCTLIARAFTIAALLGAKRPLVFRVGTRMAAGQTFAKGLKGSLIKYGPSNAHTAFISGEANKHLVLIGGLGDGLLLAPYVDNLAAAACDGEWALVQPTLQSTLQGWGVASLDEDVDDLLFLAKHLKEEFGSKGMVLLGHSTGCQDAVRYAQTHSKALGSAHLDGIVLQAAVSDREYLAGKPGTAERIKHAEQMVKHGQGEDILFRDSGVPVCARRFLSLASKGGDDDMFSSDFTDQELKAQLGHMSQIPTLLVLGGDDDCMPESIDGQALGKRMQRALGDKAEFAFIPKGTHDLSGTEKEFMAALSPFLQHSFGLSAAAIKPPYLYSCT